jgi:hypothetical protein
MPSQQQRRPSAASLACHRANSSSGSSLAVQVAAASLAASLACHQQGVLEQQQELGLGQLLVAATAAKAHSAAFQACPVGQVQQEQRAAADLAAFLASLLVGRQQLLVQVLAAGSSRSMVCLWVMGLRMQCCKSCTRKAALQVALDPHSRDCIPEQHCSLETAPACGTAGI